MRVEWVKDNTARLRRQLASVANNAKYSCKEAWATTKTMKQVDEVHKCPNCVFTFESKQAMSVHNYKMHGSVRAIRCKVDTHHCQACLQYFGSYERVVCHLVEKATRAAMASTFCACLIWTRPSSSTPTAQPRRRPRRAGRRVASVTSLECQLFGWLDRILKRPPLQESATRIFCVMASAAGLSRRL